MPAFERAIANEYDMLMSVAYRLTRRRDEARDLVHTAIERALRFKNFDQQKSTLGTWLGEIVKNVHTDNLRVKYAKKRVAVDMDGATYEPPNQENAVYLRQVLERIEKLSNTQREMIKAAMLGESQHETSVRTGVPLGTIKAAQRVARQKLVAELGRG